MAIIFLSIQMIALLIVPLFPAEYRLFEDPSDVGNPIIYIMILFFITAFLLVLAKFRKRRLMKTIFLGAILIAITTVFFPLFYQLFNDLIISFLIAIIPAAVMVALLVIRPEWYVVNAAAFLMGCGATAILGMSLGILPSILLLVFLAIYDAIAVYGTKHMITLAETVIALDMPAVFIMPKRGHFSLSSLKGNSIIADRSEREALFMGVGDAVIPGILVVSSYVFLPAQVGTITNANLFVSIGSLIGGFCGYLSLAFLTEKGKPQAGLPFLNSGTIIGFVVSYILIFGGFGLGLV
ncbi:MAG: presenilin family intramembrane aspartyl protease [Methanomassiliicoccales archaeon]|nr:presenilin family intramembrane aspartyl protease [Methanomassiliicoccales archaeon]